MTIYATLSDVPKALELYDRLLKQNVGMEKVSLVSAEVQRADRADSLHIPNFGRVWGLGSLSTASVTAAALSASGQIEVESVLEGLPEGLSRQLREGFQGGEALLEVSITGPLEQLALSAMLSAYGARVLDYPN